MTYDFINPNHYKGGRQFEPIEVIEDWGLDYHLGSALKYIARNGRKPGEDPREGLNKAIWYLERAKDQYAEAASGDILPSVLFGSDEDSIPFTATHEDILEFEAWDPSIGPIEPEEPAKDLPSHPTMDVDDEPLGHWDQAAWGEWATRDDYKKRELVRCLDKHKIAYTSKQGGYILGHQNNGDVRIIGTYGTETLDRKAEEPADNAPSEFEPEFDPFTDDQTAYDNFIFEFD